MTIGFFAPLPIALMIPFMVAQSLAMMEAAGKGWQFGKRKISAMSNEDFNKLTPHKILEDSLGEYKLMIPTMTQAFDESRQLQTKIIEVMVGYAVQLLSDIQKGVTAALQGEHEHEGTTTRIKNPFVSSFLTPAIIPPIPTEDLIPLTDTHVHEPSTVSDFEEFQKQQAEDQRRVVLVEDAQKRAAQRKKIQLPSITPKFIDPKRAAIATAAVLRKTIDTINRTIGNLQKQIKSTLLKSAIETSRAKATQVLINRERNKTIRNRLATVKFRHTTNVQNLLRDVGRMNVQIAAQRKLLVKTKSFQR